MPIVMLVSRRIFAFTTQTIKYQVRPFCFALKNMEKEQIVPDVVPKAPKGKNFYVNHWVNTCYSRQLLSYQ